MALGIFWNQVLFHSRCCYCTRVELVTLKTDRLWITMLNTWSIMVHQSLAWKCMHCPIPRLWNAPAIGLIPKLSLTPSAKKYEGLQLHYAPSTHLHRWKLPLIEYTISSSYDKYPERFNCYLTERFKPTNSSAYRRQGTFSTFNQERTILPNAHRHSNACKKRFQSLKGSWSR